MKAIHFGLMLMLMAAGAMGATINVPADQPTIQDGINVSSNGDTVVVADGTYYEYVDLSSAITLKSANGPENCIIDGQNAERCLRVGGNGDGVVIDGFTIQNGNAGADGGGGIRLSEGGNPIIQNCVLRNNNASGGGAIYSTYTSPRIRDCEFYNNETWAYGGGAIKCYRNNDNVQSDYSIIDSNVFHNNRAYFNGGAFCTEWNGMIVSSNNLVVGNQAHPVGTSYNGLGGGIATNGGTIISYNDTIMENFSGEQGGGVCCYGGTFELYNTIVYNNRSMLNGFNDVAAKNNGGGALSARNCFFSVAPGSYDGAPAPTLTNCQIGTDPQLVAPGPVPLHTLSWWLMYDYTGRDYHLSETSPCIDYEGSGSAYYPTVADVALDMDKQARPMNAGEGIPDIGADEFSTLPAAPVADAACAPYGYESESTPYVMMLDGTGSTGVIDTYAWVQTAGETVTLRNAATAVADFDAPQPVSGEFLAADCTLEFELTVSNAGGSPSASCSTYIRLPGDATGDNVINAFDLAKIRQAAPEANFNGDAVINAFDLAILRRNAGRSR